MAMLRDRRLILGIGAVLALSAGLVAAEFLAHHGRASTEAPPASQGGLTVQTGHDEDVKLDPKRPLRCFVAGRLVGELPLGECARRNGVASGALDVGLDPSGALAAANGETAQITPLPPAQVMASAQAGAPSLPTPAVAAAPDQAAPGGSSVIAICRRYAGGAWNAFSRPMTRVACARNLYDGQCEREGGAAYGRWGSMTLRLLTGRVEISGDNRTFRTLVEQGQGCSVPTFE